MALLFLLGMFTKRVGGFGAMCGLVANYIVTFGLDALPIPGKPHLLLYGFFGMLAGAVVALAADMLRKLWYNSRQ